LLATLLCGVQVAHADDAEPADRFDGSEFSASSFRNSEFDKQTYRDLTSPIHADTSEARSIRPASLLRRREEAGFSTAGRSRDVAVTTTDEKLGERLGPVHELPGDWVPDKIDLTSNGGFEISPGNGSVVPYRLNGHIDIQRGRPGDMHE